MDKKNTSPELPLVKSQEIERSKEALREKEQSLGSGGGGLREAMIEKESTELEIAEARKRLAAVDSDYAGKKDSIATALDRFERLPEETKLKLRALMQEAEKSPDAAFEKASKLGDLECDLLHDLLIAQRNYNKKLG